MLEKLTLRNFQAHKKLEIEFDKRLTVIVGPSDVGKSAVIRALSWVMRNSPDGDAFIRHGAEDAVVTLRVDGSVVMRSRGKEGNTYTHESEDFKAFGKDVPDPIKDLLRVADINFQEQHDSPFWFSESSGEVSRQLNQIVNLGIIDQTLGFLNAELRKQRGSLELIAERIGAAEAVVESSKGILAIDAHLRTVEELDAKKTKARSRYTDCAESIGNVRRLRAEAKAKEATALACESVAEKAENAWQACRRFKLLDVALGNLKHLQSVAKIKAPDFAELDVKREAFETARNKAERFKVSLNKLRDLWKEKKEADGAAAGSRCNFENKTRGENCPLCGHQL